ncbi:hypothetical protein LUZ60_014875 [Juncus effusus]|nr:hypothetical protein LUZ60_014875 [Juncus effusus]
MVWGLIPVDSPRGTQKYYIFSAGTYQVGRKDCDVIVQTDTSISRVHAEILLDKMLTWDPSNVGPTSQSHVRIVDQSKYGTFIKRESESESKRLKKDEGSEIRDGDLVTFGTGNATFRLTFIPLIVFLYGKKTGRIEPSIQSTMTSIGGYLTRKWSDDCTYVIVEESSMVTVEIIDAILSKKEIVSKDWFKVLAEQNIRTEIPSCSSYIPCLTLEGIDIKITEAKLRENFLLGHTFILGSLDKYKFGEKLHSLLEISGAKFLQVDEFCSNNSQKSPDGENEQIILVIPQKSPMEFNRSKELSSLPKITDIKLISAIFSARLEPAVIEPPSFIITSSHSTDETIVAESDMEIDCVTSNHTKDHTENPTTDPENFELRGEEKERVNAPIVDLDKENEDLKPEVKDKENTREMERINKGDDYSHVDNKDEHSDIIFSQDLIVRKISEIPAPVVMDRKEEINFKRFRKRNIVSGNSFYDLVPFAQDPYKEAEEEYSQSSQFMREEKKRKQMEAISEDLFNNEKARKRAGSTSIHALLSSR